MTLGEVDRAASAAGTAAATGGMSVRIVTHVGDGDPAGLERTALSLLDQTFRDWEWVVYVPSQADGVVRDVLSQVSAGDSRIRAAVEAPADGAADAAGDALLHLRAGETVGPVALERALWQLVSHPVLESAELDHSPGLTVRRTRSPDGGDSSASGTPDPAFDALPFSNEVPKATRRLLMIVPWLQLGGADTYTLNLAAELTRRDWEITVVTTETGDHSWLPQLERLTPDIFALSQFLVHADYPRFLRYVIDSRNPDAVLIMHSAFAYNLLPYLRRAAAGRPIVDFTHIDEQSWYDGGYARFSLESHELLDVQITASQHLKSWLVQRGAEPRRVEVCHINADVRPPERVPSRAELGLPESVPLLLYPCRVIEQKQPHVFAKTVLELSRREQPFLALVVGHGSSLPWLEAFVDRNELHEVVRFMGSWSQADVRALMEIVDIVFLPSRHEGIAASLYEAMAAGTAVVGADVGGQSELVVPECGILLPRSTEDEEARAYADALSRLLADPDACRAMGRAGQARVRSGFTLEQMGARMEKILESARAMARSRPRPTPTEDEARAAALEAVEVAPWTSLAPGLSSRTRLWRLRVGVLLIVTRFGSPIYRLLVGMGLGGVEPIRRWLIVAFNPTPRSKRTGGRRRQSR